MAGLSITRKKGQTVVVETPGYAMVIDVEETTRSKVRLKFLAPQDVRIHRGERFASVRGFDEYDRLIVDENGSGEACGTHGDNWTLFDEDCEAASGSGEASGTHASVHGEGTFVEGGKDAAYAPVG